MARGLLFTVMLGFLALALITMNYEMYYYMREMEDTGYVYAEQNRLEEAYSSVGFDLGDLIMKASGIYIEYNESIIIFNETIPNPEQAQKFKGAMDVYQNFGPNQSAEIKININKLKKNLHFIVRPGGTNYTHEDYGENNIIIQHSNNVSKYNITVRTDKNITSCAWSTQSGTPEVPLGVYVHTTFVGSKFPSCNEVRNVGLAQQSVFNVNQYNLTINLTNYRLYIINEWNTQINVSSKIYLDEAHNITGVYIPADIVIGNSKKNGITKNGEIRIL